MPELFENVKKEQEFLLELGLNMSDDDYKYKIDNDKILQAVRSIQNKPELFEEVKAMVESSIKEGV